MPRSKPSLLVAVVLDRANPLSREVLAGILDHAKPRGWRIGDETAAADADAVITDSPAAAPGVRRRVTLSTGWRADTDVRPDSALIRQFAGEHFGSRGFAGWVENPTDVAAVGRPGACLFTTDAAAAAGIRSAVAAGRSVPGDLVVLGLGNDPLVCERCATPLSSIDVHPRRIGRTAAERLSRIFAGRGAAGATVVPPLGVVERASTDASAIDDVDVVAAVRFIREHAAGPLRVGDVLRASGLDRRTLERRFARHLGHSPAETIRHTRVAAAAKLLRETTLPVTEIARATGFSLAQHLAAAFKAIVGQTPTDYRSLMAGSGVRPCRQPKR